MAEKTEIILKDLLPERFEEGLTDAESKLLDLAPAGEPLDLQEDKPEIDDPAKADDWDKDRIIRAEFLWWICTDKKASDLIDPRGIQISGARIEGVLDFSGATIPHRLMLAFCSIKGGITLLDAATRSINLLGSHTGPIIGDRLKIEGALFLWRGFKAEGGLGYLARKFVATLFVLAGVLITSTETHLSPMG